MPELPEVETVRRTLEPLVAGRTIRRTDIYYGGIIKAPDQDSFRERLAGQRIQAVERRGKYLLFRLDGKQTLIIHLRMTGQLVACEAGVPPAAHTHLVFHLSDGLELRFVDIRKFGLVYLAPDGVPGAVKGLEALGPEPLGQEFTISCLTERLRRKKCNVKAFLLDQTQIAGIGNIYADEILFAARLHPEKPAAEIGPAEAADLHQAIRAKLREAIDCRGTSFRNYIDARGEKGGFQHRLAVYGRGGKPCPRCGRLLVKKKIAGRGSVFCPDCQRL